MLTLEIGSVAHDGRGIGFYGGAGRGKAVFVAGALPGQTVTCKLLKERKNFAEAQLLEIIADAELRRDHDCFHREQCGGCPWGTMRYDAQLAWKKRLAVDAMIRIGGIQAEALDAVTSPVQASPLLSGYRNKLQLAFGRGTDGQLNLGFRKRGSHEVATLQSCPAAEEGSTDIIAQIANLARDSGLPPWVDGKGFWRFLVLRHGFSGKRLAWHALCITSSAGKRERKLVRRMAAQALAKCKDLAAFVHEDCSSGAMRATGQRRLFSLAENEVSMEDAATLELSLLEEPFRLDVSSFFQVNTSASQKLAECVKNLDARCLSRESLLDMCCGVGAPGLLLADRYSRAHGVESNPRAVECAVRNARGRATYACADAGAFLRNAGSWSTILVDPPRAGLGISATGSILKSHPENILYISCNSPTLARDSSLLKAEYELRQFSAVDLFPHTPHLECCTLWTRRQ